MQQQTPKGPGVADIEREKSASLLQRLFRCARLVNEAALERFRSESGLPVRAAHAQLFPHIDWEGTPVGVLAERVGISKQAISQLVDDLEAAGVVVRRADESDRRVRRVFFSTKGKRRLMQGLKVLQDLEEEIRAQAGDAVWAGFRAGIETLESWLKQQGEALKVKR